MEKTNYGVDATVVGGYRCSQSHPPRICEQRAGVSPLKMIVRWLAVQQKRWETAGFARLDQSLVGAEWIAFGREKVRDAQHCCSLNGSLARPRSVMRFGSLRLGGHVGELRKSGRGELKKNVSKERFRWSWAV